MDHDETTDPVVADVRNFYKVELWTPDDHIVRLLYAGSSLSRAQRIFAEETLRSPGGRLTIRQRSRVLRKWPLTDRD